jgi:hypothetical protein
MLYIEKLNPERTTGKKSTMFSSHISFSNQTRWVNYSTPVFGKPAGIFFPNQTRWVNYDSSVRPACFRFIVKLNQVSKLGNQYSPSLPAFHIQTKPWVGIMETYLHLCASDRSLRISQPTYHKGGGIRTFPFHLFILLCCIIPIPHLYTYRYFYP